jgi:hypothetical protein
MSNLISIPPAVNGSPVNGPPLATIPHVIAWVEANSSRGDMGKASATTRVTALRQIAEQVAPGEPADARSVLGNIDDLPIEALVYLDSLNETRRHAVHVLHGLA